MPYDDIEEELDSNLEDDSSPEDEMDSNEETITDETEAKIANGNVNLTTEQYEKLISNQQNLVDSVSYLKEQINLTQQQQQTNISNDQVEKEEVDLDLLDNSELAAHIIDKTVKALSDRVINPMQEKLNNVEETAAQDRAVKNVQDAAKKHNDFWDWKSEMVDITKNYPNIAAEDAYHLARAKNNSKAKTLRQKYADRGMGINSGLRPGSKKALKSSQNLSFDAAFDKAYDEYMAPYGE